ncbi:DUF1761 domain-containing protein [Marinibacterium profundimaris]|uniref:DUF1761 domain-containing protein n=1 Tax=Marinibacterium profundimaris TaxID=1679460 RepID=A0A225NN46_9RHOB|nr:DUF1761 domain-containing protein [Marinibacterium profundimaris]OWU75813.1 hypothetical protein ATO3_06380 [Marinibacterium profundimaris]
MELLKILLAAAASYVFGALWYMVLSKRWIEASGVGIDAKTGRPANASDPVPYVTAFIASVMVAGIMRHTFQGAGITTPAMGSVAGLGFGLFLVSPWIATFYGFSDRPRALVLIDGGYATIGCGLIGLVLTLF